MTTDPSLTQKNPSRRDTYLAAEGAPAQPSANIAELRPATPQTETISQLINFLSADPLTHRTADFLHSGLPDEHYEIPRSLLREIQGICRHSGLEVIIETPRSWINGGGGSRYTRALFMNLHIVLDQLGTNSINYVVTANDTFTPRILKPNQLCFSTHSADPNGVVSPNIVRIKETYLPPYFTCDPTGFSGWGTLANDPGLIEEAFAQEENEANAFLQQLRFRIRTEGVSKYSQPESNGPPIDRPYVFHPMQIATDRVMTLAYVEQQKLLSGLVEQATSTGVPLVIKRHPRCKDQDTAALIERAARESDHVIISQGSIHDLIEHSQAVVVVNSGTGMEALIQGKPVYSAGRSDYQPLTNIVTSPEHVRDAFVDPRSRRTPVDEARYISFYFGTYCMNACSPRNVQLHVIRAIDRWHQSSTTGESS